MKLDNWWEEIVHYYLLIIAALHSVAVIRDAVQDLLKS